MGLWEISDRSRSSWLRNLAILFIDTADLTVSRIVQGATIKANLRMLNNVMATKAVLASILWSLFVKMYVANVARPT